MGNNKSPWGGLTKQQQKEQKKQLRKKRATIAGIILVLCTMLFSATSPGQRFWRIVNGGDDLGGIFSSLDDGQLHIYFFDVGKADAILITCEDKAVLIDAGTYDHGETVEIWMKKLKIEKLDAVFLSHPDSDHIGGMAHIIDSFPVDQLIVPDVPEEIIPHSDEYQDLLSAIKRNEIPVRIAENGDVLSYGVFSFDILGPIGNHTDTNNYSLVQKLKYQEISVLFCGDAEKRSEQFLLDSDVDVTADVLKVSHHGSKTSSTKEFLDAVNATYAVISTGPDRNKLPKKQVLKSLEECGMEIFRTDTDKTIVMTTDGKEVTMIRENEK